MLMPPFPVALGSDEGLVAAAVLAGAAVGLEAPAGAAATFEAPDLPATGWATTLRGGLPGVGFSTELMPIVRAESELASLVAFSRICFCFSSSLARIETRSSGIGLLSYAVLSIKKQLRAGFHDSL